MNHVTLTADQIKAVNNFRMDENSARFALDIALNHYSNTMSHLQQTRDSLYKEVGHFTDAEILRFKHERANPKIVSRNGEVTLEYPDFRPETNDEV